MKKYLLLLLFIILIPSVKAVSELPTITSYVDGYAYSNEMLLTDTWAYDINTNRYVKLGTEGNILYELDEPNKDPYVERGKFKLSANVPNNLKDMEIEVEIATMPYDYVFILNKDNNFTIEEDVIADTYTVTLTLNKTDEEYEVFFPSIINVYSDKETSIDLDYSKYEVKEEERDIKGERNKTILIAFGVVFFTFFLIILIMFLKARSI